MQVDGIISTGFCGALDPALRVGDIVRDLHSIDRVAVTAAEKRELRVRTGAAAVDMESAAIARKAADWRIPFHIIRAVSDIAEEDMPLDFNAYRGPDGRFSRTRIALAALARPLTRVPALLRLDRNCRIAAESLGDCFAHCRL
jgi:adenosylhomocysteine nucleosidase